MADDGRLWVLGALGLVAAAGVVNQRRGSRKLWDADGIGVCYDGFSIEFDGPADRQDAEVEAMEILAERPFECDPNEVTWEIQSVRESGRRRSIRELGKQR